MAQYLRVRTLPFAKRPPHFKKRNVLQLANPLPGDTEFHPDFLKRDGFGTIETKACIDNAPFPLIKLIQKIHNLLLHVLVAKMLEGINSRLITDKFTCEDHFGTTGALLAGNYVVSVDALDSANRALSSQSTTVTKSITAPDGLTDLGNIMIPIQ